MLGFTAVAMMGKRIGLPQQPTALPGFEEFDDGPTEPTSSDVESDGRLKLHRPPGNWQETFDNRDTEIKRCVMREVPTHPESRPI